jgi:hypothetical protein
VSGLLRIRFESDVKTIVKMIGFSVGESATDGMSWLMCLVGLASVNHDGCSPVGVN